MCPPKSLDAVSKYFPGIAGPTVMNIMGRDDVVAVHVVIDKDKVYDAIARLKKMGATGHPDRAHRPHGPLGEDMKPEVADDPPCGTSRSTTTPRSRAAAHGHLHQSLGGEPGGQGGPAGMHGHGPQPVPYRPTRDGLRAALGELYGLDQLRTSWSATARTRSLDIIFKTFLEPGERS